jgi:hypothetical protein
MHHTSYFFLINTVSYHRSRTLSTVSSFSGMDSSNRVKPQNLRTSTDAGMQSTAHEEKGGEIIETEVGEGAELMKTEEGEGEGEELLKTEEEDDDPVSEMPCIAKDITLANEAKEEGNNFFRTKDFDSAISSYSRAITLITKRF